MTQPLHLGVLFCLSLADAWNSNAGQQWWTSEVQHSTTFDSGRRRAVQRIAWSAGWVPTTRALGMDESNRIANEPAHIQHPYTYSPQWTGTCLPLLSLSNAVHQSDTTSAAPWPMARWPDPILRTRAEPVDESFFGTDTLQRACLSLQATARAEGAVGLAAQQCGVPARILYLERYEPALRSTHGSDHSLILVNPRVTARSPETSMQVWTETCLVLPPTFVATVLRDAWLDVAYRTVQGPSHTIRLTGAVARAAQHELDHDRGLLVTDHVALDELENDAMRDIERPGHASRMVRAYERYIQ